MAEKISSKTGLIISDETKNSIINQLLIVYVNLYLEISVKAGLISTQIDLSSRFK